MGVTVRKKNKSSWLVTLHQGGEREFVTLKSQQDAKDLAQYVRRQELAGLNVVETMRQARAKRLQPAPEYPTLRDALAGWIDSQVQKREIRQTTGRCYARHARVWLYPQVTADGRTLGDLPVNEVQREHVGAVITRVREAGRSRGIINGLQFPLKRYFADLIERRVLSGPNPAADLRHFVGRMRTRKHRPIGRLDYFTQEEGPILTRAAQAFFPRWYPFILTDLLGALRWGETAALQKSDIDWRRGRLHVERTISDRGRCIEECKDHEARTVTATPALLAALREHVDAVDLEGLTKGWNEKSCSWVFPMWYGHPVRYSHFQSKVWKPLLAKAGLKYRSYHKTRHTFAVWHLENGADLRWVRDQMGHASISMTADTYGHLIPERHDKAAAQIDRFVHGGAVTAGRDSAGSSVHGRAFSRSRRASGARPGSRS